MIFRNYLGVDVSGSELRAVRLRRNGRKTALLGGRVLSLPAGVLRATVREPNIADLPRFIDAVHEILDPLAGAEDRVALSLPDTAGRLLLTEVENPFKTKAEGIEVLKWQLKGSLPAEAREVRLDFQVLDRTESGRLRLIVVAMAEKVLLSYEEALAAAGYQTAVVDFHTLSLYNFYRPRLELGENFILVAVERNLFSFQYFQGRLLTFHRAREIASRPDALLQELNRSLVAAEEVSPGLQKAAVFLHSDIQERELPAEVVRAACAREVVSLEPHLERMAPSQAGGALRAERGLAAAVGAAERMM